jgi:hypothetical protein
VTIASHPTGCQELCVQAAPTGAGC